MAIMRSIQPFLVAAVFGDPNDKRCRPRAGIRARRTVLKREREPCGDADGRSGLFV